MSPELYYSIIPDCWCPSDNRVIAPGGIHYAFRSIVQSSGCWPVLTGLVPPDRVKGRLQGTQALPSIPYKDRKGVVEGKSGSVRLSVGGCWIFKKNKKERSAH